MAITIRALIEGRDSPISVEPDKTARVALDTMLRHDYTQLPVVDAAHKPIGLITSDSILRAVDSFGLGVDALLVKSAMEPARRVDPDDDVSELLNGLRDHYAVLVVDGASKLIGILTGYDAAEYFRSRAEDLMLVEDIESSVKEYILFAFTEIDGTRNDARLNEAIESIGDSMSDQRRKFKGALRLYASTAGLATVDDGAAEEAFARKFGATEGRAKSFDSLTFKQYADVLMSQFCWPTVQPRLGGIELTALSTLLNGVRDARNALAHFREISPSARERVRVCARWLEQYPLPAVVTLQPAVVVAVATAPISLIETSPSSPPLEELVAPSDSKYARLALSLQGTSSDQSTVTLTIKQIEAIIEDDLPRSAREHRSWWANDSTSHSQSREWLDVGWRVSNFNLLAETVTFERIHERERAYIEFFSKSLAGLRKQNVFRVKDYSPLGLSWHVFASLARHGRQQAILVQSFARGQRFRVELYLDTGEQRSTKAAFDHLATQRDSIELEIGELLSWERMEDRRASRVACYRPGSITDPAPSLDSLLPWAIDMTTRFWTTFQKALERSSPT